ncbi:unnamed protein product [Lactuca virosa]|uniref:Uncharacterized protein n=1 Tax=Lactuca virosa TaxID=75947 RepID=A0AAU9MS59_9ASTR|nr:unnamed protein product [Lactuca virosa]CAH1429730.1 unnamed protein product [Lactuca virosa]
MLLGVAAFDGPNDTDNVAEGETGEEEERNVDDSKRSSFGPENQGRKEPNRTQVDYANNKKGIMSCCEGVQASISNGGQHVGDEGNKAHCNVNLFSGKFNGQSLMKPHQNQMVYDASHMSFSLVSVIFCWICCYMAKREFGSDVSEDLTRESLIALSYTLPDTNLSSTDVTKSSKSVKNVEEAVNSDEREKFRADLISISYAESPDTKDLPVSIEKNKG